VLIAGKEFPETPQGYRAAADHVWSLGPAFEQDGYDLLREARRVDDENRLRRFLAAGAILVCVAMVLWNLYK
jgi:hypothetical protein